ncbi:MAG: sigma-70 family RNA polymerase sigma factor [Desulfobacteraceae bacterium]|nr:sigma-70 family RNA polymerase sigma factor [Desulfobacteraceae bacterium]
MRIRLNENPADNVLRTALAGNDPAAVGLLWDRYAKDLLAYLQAILCSLHDAEDVLQIVFVRIVRKRHQLAKARCLDAYIFRIARNEALRLIGRRKIDSTAKAAGDPWLIKSESSGDSQDLAESLQKALARLPQTQRGVIVMKTYRQKTFLEIAQLLGLSQNTVASRYRYGMEKMRILLENLI